MNLSIIIITLNEEQHIKKCLDSPPPQSEVIVVDSGSSDETPSILKSRGIVLHTRPFDHYAAQKNYAASLASHDWVFSIDADECMDPELRKYLEQGSFFSSTHSAYKTKRRLIFQGRKMRFGKSSDEPLRLFRKSQCQFENEIHEKITIQKGTLGVVKGTLWHYSYDDLSDYFIRFNRYTSLIAKNHFQGGRHLPIFFTLRPWFEFISRYFFRLGILDGYQGYVYAPISSMYVFIKYAKLQELYAFPPKKVQK